MFCIDCRLLLSYCSLVLLEHASLEDIERETKHSLTVIDLSHNDIGAAGGVALGEMLGVITRLERVILKSNKLEDKAAQSIGQAVRR